MPTLHGHRATPVKALEGVTAGAEEALKKTLSIEPVGGMSAIKHVVRAAAIIAAAGVKNEQARSCAQMAGASGLGRLFPSE